MDNRKSTALLLTLAMAGIFPGCSANGNASDTDISDESDAVSLISDKTTSENNVSDTPEEVLTETSEEITLPPETSAETSANEIIAAGHVKSSYEYAELKEAPDMNSATLMRVYKDYDVNVYRMEKDWFFCNCDGFDGYLKAEYVDFGEKQSEPETSAETSPVVTTKDIRVNEDITDIDYYVNNYAYANVDSSLAVRSGPSTDYVKIMDLYKGDSMYVHYALTNSRGYTWYYVSIGDINGYVIAKYTTFSYNDVAYQPEYYYTFDAYVSTNYDANLNMRDSPNGKIIAKIPNGEYVVVYNTDNSSWWYVYYNGTYGYVSPDYLVVCGGECEKPVIYLYPQEKTDVSVKLELNGKFKFTYPQYNDGWNVTAYPDGTITDKDGNNYSYIFWDAEIYDEFDFSTGFVVKGSDTLKFLNEKLEYMGLNENEKNEFIVYWVPRMMNNRYNLISFQMHNYEEMAKLYVSPEPDSVLRVFMAFRPLDEYMDIPEQKLLRFERKGFSLVEWGGAEVKP